MIYRLCVFVVGVVVLSCAMRAGFVSFVVDKVKEPPVAMLCVCVLIDSTCRFEAKN